MNIDRCYSRLPGSSGFVNYRIAQMRILRLTIPANVNSIGQYSFMDCKSIKSVSFSGTAISSIPHSMFSGCTSLESINIPSSITTIGDYAFSACKSLKNVTVTSGTTNYGSHVFDDCKIDEFYYQGTLQNWCSINFADRTSNPKSNTEKLYINGAEIAGTLTIPESLSSISSYAFYGWGNISIVNFGTNSQVASIGNGAFRSCTGIKSVQLPSGVISIGSEAFQGCVSLESITMQSAVKSIGDFAFLGCEVLNNVAIPNSVTSIGNYAFSGCLKLSNITLSSAIDTIAGGLFYGCVSLTQITIPSNVEIIYDSAFEYCSYLTSIAIPANVEEIGQYVFNGCRNLTSISFANAGGWKYYDSRKLMEERKEGKTIDFSDPIQTAIWLTGEKSFRFFARG